MKNFKLNLIVSGKFQQNCERLGWNFCPVLLTGENGADDPTNVADTPEPA